jgi:hypothetical protein
MATRFLRPEAPISFVCSPRALQLQAGPQGQLITPTDRNALYQTVRPVYGEFGSAEQLNYVLHKEKVSFPGSEQTNLQIHA